MYTVYTKDFDGNTDEVFETVADFYNWFISEYDGLGIASAWVEIDGEDVDLFEYDSDEFYSTVEKLIEGEQPTEPTPERTFAEAAYYTPTPKQQKYAGKLAREIRDRLTDMTGSSFSAHRLAKYYTIDDLKDALDMLREGKLVAFI